MLDFFLFKQKTAYEMRISDWSSDVCSSDLQNHQDLVLQASDCLTLQNISLVRSLFERPNNFPSVPEELELQQKYDTGFIIETPETQDHKLLRARVELGTRLVSKSNPNTVFVIIEAGYIADYHLTDDLPDEALQSFVQFNSVHNVWPFWRQHVFSTTAQARLPHTDIPDRKSVV